MLGVDRATGANRSTPADARRVAVVVPYFLPEKPELNGQCAECEVGRVDEVCS
jgi:hypothetical protein